MVSADGTDGTRTTICTRDEDAGFGPVGPPTAPHCAQCCCDPVAAQWPWLLPTLPHAVQSRPLVLWTKEQASSDVSDREWTLSHAADTSPEPALTLSRVCGASESNVSITEGDTVQEHVTELAAIEPFSLVGMRAVRQCHESRTCLFLGRKQGMPGACSFQPVGCHASAALYDVKFEPDSGGWHCHAMLGQLDLGCHVQERRLQHGSLTYFWTPVDIATSQPRCIRWRWCCAVLDAALCGWVSTA